MSQGGTSVASWGSFNTPPLFAAIGTVWGSAGPGLFNGPDFRGIFPRGWNHGKNSGFFDPDASSRVAAYTSGASGDSIGSYETDQFKSHTHTYVEGVWPNGVTAGGFSGSSGNMGLQPTGAAGGNETRPVNASVMYIMRVQ
jgi:microcystin-dependent protein